MIATMLPKLADELRKVEDQMAEIMRGLAKIDANLRLIQATNDSWRAGNRPLSNGYLK
jgi:hypothetical protein